MLAKNVNDYACILNKRVVLRFFASKLAPTDILSASFARLGLLRDIDHAMDFHADWPGARLDTR
ncbi:hypothetical protein FQ186_03340 [Pseudomonas sp. ANT_H14]|nr:hypothetical protein FQ182_04955 [Pseudomonas sp. ANT_H4]KAA0954214.1 hypothetical protein FQ186_03340 [Pseudomonas sp. ANT_H14]